MAIDDFNDTCLCGHVRDEHSRITGCEIKGCSCTRFEIDEDAADDVRYDPDEDSEEGD